MILFWKWDWIPENWFHQKSFYNICYFWEFLGNFSSYVIFGPYRSFRYFPKYREFILIFHFSLFPIFSLLPQTRVSPTWDSAFNAEILFMPPHAAFNALLINSNQVIMTFVLLLKRSLLHFLLDAAFIPASSSFGLDATIALLRRNLIGAFSFALISNGNIIIMFSHPL